MRLVASSIRRGRLVMPLLCLRRMRVFRLWLRSRRHLLRLCLLLMLLVLRSVLMRLHLLLRRLLRLRLILLVWLRMLRGVLSLPLTVWVRRRRCWMQRIAPAGPPRTLTPLPVGRRMLPSRWRSRCRWSRRGRLIRLSGCCT